MTLRAASEAPGLRVFTALLVSSVLLLAGFPGSDRLLGLLILFWSFFCLLRALRIIETALLPADPEKQRRSRLLPWIILSEKNLRQRLDSGRAALRASNADLLIFLLAGGALAGWAFYLRLFPVYPEALAATAKQIGIFLHAHSDHASGELPGITPGWTGFLSRLSQILWISLMVWACRSYACAARQSGVLLKGLALCFALCLGLCLMANGPADSLVGQPLLWAGSGWNSFPAMEATGFFSPHTASSFSVRAVELGLRGMVLFYIPCIVAAVAVLKNAGRSERRKNCALAAAGVLIVMALADLLLADGPRAFVLWLSGWSLTATLWGCASTSRKECLPFRP